MKSNAARSPRYNDGVFRLFIGIPVAMMFVLYGETEYTFFEAIMYTNFWIAVGVSYIIVQLLMLYINWLSGKLDKHYCWRLHTTQRTMLQILTGLVVPALFAFYLAALYFRLFFDISIHDTVYLDVDYVLVVLLLIVANVYYLSYYLWFIPPYNAIETEQKQKNVFLAQLRDRTVAIPADDIAAVYIEGDYTMLRTWNMETFVITQSLTKVMDELNTQEFFRINPRFIINYKLCREYRKGKNSSRELILGSPLNRTETITRSRIKEFNEWLVR